MNARHGFDWTSAKTPIASFLALLCGAVLPLSAQTIPAVWTGFDPVGSTATGTLGPLSVSATQVRSAATGTADLSWADYAAARLSVAQGVLDYEQQSDFAIRLNHPVKGLMLYLVAWRPSTYTFSKPFTRLSGLTGATITGNTLTTAAGFTEGILQFSEPLSSFSVSTPSGNVSRQDLTLGVNKERTQVGIGQYDARTNRSSVFLRGSASATFGVRKVLVKNGRKAPRSARLSKQGQEWRFRVALNYGTNRIRIQAIGFDGSKSKHRVIRISRKQA